ncbi:S-layer homology domain-containing protein [Paenibacillus aquistagni]|uniref:S-layer homology domain-containing protein n=1 Tax=Paenibacillus aquistagni TaxID=1852522 RepID=UPI00145BCD63|nr:S-layer homology domain-containing protein [Paenibacillus aquistagni]NMM54329.1 S-layer homology domain-containing protein [Paenibacillus aquistagni]
MREMGYQSSKKNSQQPKEFRGGEKKVMKKRLALLLSVAMAFSMFANVAFGASSDLTTTQKYDALVKEGIFTGIAGSNDPQLNATTTRAQFAKVLALTLGLEPVNTGSSFKDQNYDKHWAKPYVEALVKENLITGYADGKFHFNDTVTGEQMAKTFGAALGLEEVKDAAAIEGVSKWAYGWVQAVKDAGFDWSENGKWNVPAKRATLVEASYDVREQTSVQVESARALDEKTVEVKFTDGETKKVTLEKALVEGEEATVKVEHKGKTYEVKVTLQALAAEAKAVGSSKAQLTFNRTVDSSKIKVEVKRGGTSVAVKEVKVADDKLSAVVETSNKLIEGDYTVTITGVSQKDVTATFKAENEKIAKIELLGDTAASNDNYSGFSVPYQVTNQYGEDASKSASIEWKSTKGTVSDNGNGVLTVTGPEGDAKANQYTFNEQVVITGIENNSYQVVNKTYKIGLPAKAAEVEFGEIYNANKEALTTSSNFGDFFIPVVVKDQYGNKLDKEAIGDSLRIISNNPTIANVEEKLVINSGPNNDQLAIQLKDPTSTSDFRFSGDVTITAIALGGGKSFTKTINVSAGQEVATIKLSQPEKIVAVGDKDVKIPFTAYDKNGKEVTAYKYLQNIQLSSVGDVEMKQDYETKKGFISYTPSSAKGDSYTDYISAVIPGTANNHQITINVKAKATAKTVAGTSAATILAEGATVTLNKDNIKLNDQHGRSYDFAKAFEAGNDYHVGLTASSYKNLKDRGIIEVAADEGNLDKVTVDGALLFNNADSSLKLTAKKKGVQAIELALFKEDKDGKMVQQQSSTASFNMTVTDKGNISEYSVDDLGTLFAAKNEADGTVTALTYAKASDYQKEVSVFGLNASGQKVKLATSDYTIIPNHSGVKVTSDNKLFVPEANISDFKDDVKTTVTVIITANETNQTVNKEVTISDNSPLFQSFEVKDPETAGDRIERVNGNYVEIKALDGIVTLDEISKAVKAKDQYGVSAFIKGDKFVKHVSFNPSTSKVENGAVTGLLNGDTFKVTFTSPNSTATITLTIGVTTK